MTLSWTPIRLDDALGSITVLALAITSFVVCLRWYRRRLWDLFRHYLFFFTLALVIFAISRSGGHLVKQILILNNQGHLWQILSPFTGALNTATFIVIFAVSLYSRRIGMAHREITSYQNDLENIVAKRTRLLEEQLNFQKELMESIPIPVFFTNNDGRFTGCNKAFTRMLDCEGTNIINRMPEEIKELRPCLPFLDLCPDKENAGGMIKREGRLHCRKDKEIEVILYGTPFTNQAGEQKGYIGVIIDISERKLLEAQILQTEKLETVATMAGGISHEFNNILAAIMGFAELARHKIDQGIEVAHDIDQILISSRRARDLVKQMLVFSRQKSLNRGSCDLGEIIENAANLLRHRLKKGMEIELDLSPEATIIMGDQGQMQQVFLNLGHNGIKAMEEKGGNLKITSERISLPSASFPSAHNLDTGDYVCVRVTDRGTGIAPEVMRRIFDPFFSTREVGQGSGLGLSVVHGVIKNHGGMVRVESSPGHGTNFEILLPLIDPEPLKKNSGPPAPAENHGAVLLVDDEETVMGMLATMIKRLGFKVMAFNNPELALEEFNAAPHLFGLALLDEIMPAMPGTELGKRLKKKRPEIPIIICSGYSADTEGKPGHVNVWLDKPVTLKDLQATLERFLARPSIQGEQTG